MGKPPMKRRSTSVAGSRSPTVRRALGYSGRMPALARLRTLLFALLTASAAPWMGEVAAQTAPSTQPPKVRLLATGGTISNRVGGRLTADDLIKAIPNLDRY